MPHPFSNALYYPTIDISNTGWLKTTALFWDSISTIVPESLDAPYRERDTQYLSDIGFLRPLYVNSNDEAVVGIESDILSLLSSPEVIQAFFYDSGSRLTHIHRSKISYQLEETICEIQRHPIYADKLSMRIRKEIDNSINDSPQDFYYVNDSFASFYMTALANKLCESRTLAMITDTVPFLQQETLSNSAINQVFLQIDTRETSTEIAKWRRVSFLTLLSMDFLFLRKHRSMK